MIDVNLIVGTVYNTMRNEFNKYLAAENKKTKPALRVSPIDGFENEIVQPNGKRMAMVYSLGPDNYRHTWDSDPELDVTVVLALTDTDSKLMLKYFSHLVNFLNKQPFGISRLCNEGGTFSKQGGAECEGCMTTLTIVIDTMEDDDE